MVSGRKLRGLVLGCGALAVGASSAACAAVFGFERLGADEGDGATTPETAVDAADATPPFEAGTQCGQLGLPEKPVADGGSQSIAPLHMALKVFDVGIDSKVGPAGLNLDRTCSPTLALGSCTAKVSEATFDTYARDLDDKGLDNAGYGLLGYLALLGDAFKPAEVNRRLANGEYGFVLRLSSWNGLPEDEDVLLEVFPALGVAVDAEAGVPVVGGKPKFVASDYWLRDSRFKNVVDASTLRSASAYVTGGRLVASFDTVSMPINVPDDKKPLDIIVQGGFLFGSVVPDGVGFKITDGVLAGRWRTADILAQVRTIYLKDTIGFKNVYVCDQGLVASVYKAAKKEVCNGRDLRASISEDNKGLPCEAVSAGIRFDSYALDSAGGFADLPVIPARCQQDGAVPLGDDCAP